MHLPAASRLTVPRVVVNETATALREYGRHGLEGLVLWIGELVSNETTTEARVRDLVVPPQRSIRSEDGVGYFVSSETLFALNKLLSEHNLRLLAQVHSHPTSAYHSETDDRYAIATTEGALSIVVPDFGRDAEDPGTWATYRLGTNGWDELTEDEAKRYIHIMEGE